VVFSCHGAETPRRRRHGAIHRTTCAAHPSAGEAHHPPTATDRICAVKLLCAHRV
jgi:hypothetical protein